MCNNFSDIVFGYPSDSVTALTKIKAPSTSISNRFYQNIAIFMFVFIKKMIIKSNLLANFLNLLANFLNLLANFCNKMIIKSILLANFLNLLANFCLKMIIKLNLLANFYLKMIIKLNLLYNFCIMKNYKNYRTSFTYF